MTIQTTPGAIVVNADDLQLTHRGITIAVKIRMTAWPTVMGVIKQADGSWKFAVDLTDDIFASDPPNGGDMVGGWVTQLANGDMITFIRNIILPKLNAWLKAVFPPVAAPAPAPTAAFSNDLDGLQKALGGIKFTTAADGTVTASI